MRQVGREDAAPWLSGLLRPPHARLPADGGVGVRLPLRADRDPATFYSFNAGTSLAIWEGFSLRWYHAAWHERARSQAATFRSLGIATIAAVVSTVLATMAAIVPTRGGAFRGADRRASR